MNVHHKNKLTTETHQSNPYKELEQQEQDKENQLITNHKSRRDRTTQSRWLQQNKDLVIAVSSSALLDLTESDKIYREQSVEAYEEYQTEHVDEPLQPGVAAPFVTKLLKFNKILQRLDPTRGVEIVVVSRNSPRTGLRAMKSLADLGLPIDKSTFTSGRSPAPYIETAYGADLFLSTNREDVHEAARLNLPAGRIVLENNVTPGEDPHPNELRVAFDFDGIIAGDSSEKQFQEYLQSSDQVQDALNAYNRFEQDHADDPIEEGPLIGLLRGINQIQKTIKLVKQGRHEALKSMTDEERNEILETLDDAPSIRTYVVTARGTETVERALNTLDAHDIHIDEMTMLAGLDKTPTLDVIQPDMFFDDQSKNITPYSSTPSVHVPLGICNPCVRQEDVKKVFERSRDHKNRQEISSTDR